MNWFLAGRTLKYLITAKHKNGHGIHSPFLYLLIISVFKNKTDRLVVKVVERSRKEYRSDRRLISVNDLGSGSLKIKSKLRRISEIARYTSVRPKYGSLLSKLASYVNGNQVIELGTSLGLGSMYLALGAPDSKVYTIEGCENIASIAKEKFRQIKIPNIECITGSFDDLLDELLAKAGSIGLIYIDGNHRSEPLLRYMKSVIRYVNEDTIVIIDDIHYSRDMEMGWNTLKGWKSISLSVDILQMGLLFFKSGIRKQDFMIRY